MTNHQLFYTRFAIIFSVAAAGLGFGLSIPLVTVQLNQSGAPTGLVGLVAVASACGMFLASVFAEQCVAKLGYRKAMVTVAAACALFTFLLVYPLNYSSLLLVRFLFGCGFGLMVVLGESWINELVGSNYRGRLIALYTTTYTLFQLVGPTSIASFGADNVGIIYLCVGAFTLSGLLLRAAQPLFITRSSKADDKIVDIIKKSPDIYAGVFFFALFDITVLALLPVYLSLHGYTEKHALLLVSVVFAGDALCQYLIGYIADKTKLAHVYLSCTLLTVFFVLLIMAAVGYPPALWVVLFVLGATAGGIYTLALTLIGDEYRGTELVAANAGVGIIVGMGSIAGPFLGGFATQITPSALPFLFLVFISILLILIIRTRYKFALKGLYLSSTK